MKIKVQKIAYMFKNLGNLGLMCLWLLNQRRFNYTEMFIRHCFNR